MRAAMVVEGAAVAVVVVEVAVAMPGVGCHRRGYLLAGQLRRRRCSCGVTGQGHRLLGELLRQPVGYRHIQATDLQRASGRSGGDSEGG